MPELIVTCRELRYAGKPYLRGERFTATDKDAKTLKAIKKAAAAPEPPLVVEPEATPQPEAEASAKPEADAGPEPEAEAPGPQRAPYRTRRLKAED